MQVETLCTLLLHTSAQTFTTVVMLVAEKVSLKRVNLKSVMRQCVMGGMLTTSSAVRVCN